MYSSQEPGFSMLKPKMEIGWQEEGGFLVNDHNPYLYAPTLTPPESFSSGEGQQAYSLNEDHPNLRDSFQAYHARKEMESFNENPQHGVQPVPAVVPALIELHCWMDKNDCKSPNQKFSQKLQKAYVLESKVVLVTFSVTNLAPGIAFYIRAQLSFTDEEFLKEPVKRCQRHAYPSHQDPHKEHVLQCESGEPIYEINNARCSVLYKLPATFDPSKIPVKYKFGCKTSCSTLKKKAIHMLFTLENLEGQIFGTSKMDIRVSSAPLRDMLKDEAEPVKNRRRSGQKDDLETVPVKRKKISEAEVVKNYYKILSRSQKKEAVQMICLSLGHSKKFGTAAVQNQISKFKELFSL